MVLNKNKYRLFIFNTIILFCGVYNIAYTQNLCTNPPANTEVGAFEIVGGVTSGCSPFNVQLNDLSGGTDIRYDFFYTDKTVAQLDKTGNTVTSNPYFANTNINSYIILQYGKKNGKDMYACKTITVRPNTKPKFSFSQCNGSNNVELAIPKSIENHFAYYEITWNNNMGTKVKVDSNQIPFAIIKNVTYPAQLKVEGFPNILPGCTNVNIQTAVVVNSTNYPNGLAPPYDPNIDILTMSSKSEIIIKFNGSESPVGYNLNIRENSTTYNYSLLKQGVLPGNVKVTVPDSNKSYCFYFTRNTCREYSSEVCTIPLEPITVASNTYNLNWNSYPNNINGIPIITGRYTLDKEIYIQQKSGNTISEFLVNNNDIKYQEEIKDCIAGNQFRIKIIITGLLDGYRYNSIAYSNWQTLKINQIVPPSLEEVVTSVLDKNFISIKFKDDKLWKIPKTKYFLFGSTDNVLDSTNISNEFTYPISNTSTNTSFKVGYKDKCEYKSVLSKKVYPIFLNQNDKLNLEWTNNNPFSNQNVKAYNLILLDEITKNKKIEWLYYAPLNEAVPNFLDSESIAYYVIEAIGDLNLKSYSNILEIPIKPVIFIPNSFSPNGDNINDFFEIKGNLNGVNTYDLKIFSRWGDIVYQSADYRINWDGNISSKLAPIGTYYFKLKALYKNSEKIIKTGSFELFR